MQTAGERYPAVFYFDPLLFFGELLRKRGRGCILWFIACIRSEQNEPDATSAGREAIYL